MSSEEICFMEAHELADHIKKKDLAVAEVMDAFLTRIEQINPMVNAIVTFLPDQAMDMAREADKALARGEEAGLLYGLPIAHKDLFLSKGFKTTLGSPIFKDFIPDQDQLIVERLKNAGAISIGKTNTPEFGAGSQTYNELFGETLNPYDLTKTCGGSSGGAAVALACGMLPLADGSDMGGSLRNPASFCNVVGFRPSPGRVPVYPSILGWFTLGVDGPMARTVKDVAFMLGAIAGPDVRSPISISEPSDLFLRPLERDFKGSRLAWSSDLGELPVDAQVTEVIESQRPVFQDFGCDIIDIHPDFTDADEIFKAWRAWYVELTMDELILKHKDKIKETVIWNADEGKKLSGPDLSRIEAKRTRLYHRMREFMEKFDFLIIPVSQVPPFDVTERYVKEINDVKMETYIDWMKSCYYISAIGLPAISVPCGFTLEGLPVGVQIVGRHRDDFGVLQLAYAFEQNTFFGKQRPKL